MNKKIRIGIPGWSMGEQAFGVSKDIMDFTARFGQPVILSPSKGRDETVQAILLPGGADVNPQNYDRVPGFYTGNPDVFKEWFFKENLPKYIQAGCPVFGICLGFQQLAVHLGLPLKQHLRYHPYSDPADIDAHTISLTNAGRQYLHGEWPLDSKGKKRGLYVNSTHHQAVMLSSTEGREDIEVLAFARCEDYSKDGIVEAFKHADLPVGGVQWHPERFLYNDFGVAIHLAEEIFSKAHIEA